MKINVSSSSDAEIHVRKKLNANCLFYFPKYNGQQQHNTVFTSLLVCFQIKSVIHYTQTSACSPGAMQGGM